MGQAQFYIAGMTDLSSVIGMGPGVSGTDTVFNYMKKLADYVDTLEGLVGTSADDRADNTVLGWLRSPIKGVQRGTIGLGVSDTSGTATITAVDTSKSVLMLLGVSAAGSVFEDETKGYAKTGHQFVRLALSNSTTVTATRAEHNSKSITVAFQVVEFY